jgi:type I restriction enzyme S subunit
MAIAPKAAVIQEAYLYQWFMAFDLSTIASGSSVPQLNKQDLAPLKIQIPDHKIQEQFAAVVGALEATKAIEVSAHKECEELFSSLQYRAFRGEL